MDSGEARALLSAARVARLATADAGGVPHLVPICFAVDGDTVHTAVDHKPKRHQRLKRLANIAANPRVAVLADRYDDDDWSRLWWVRADGEASIAEPGTPRHEHAVDLLAARYAQYAERPPDGPAIAVHVGRWSGWRP